MHLRARFRPPPAAKPGRPEGGILNGLSSRFALLLLAYGGPEGLEDVPGFLARVRGGRPVSPALVESYQDRYRRIGGRSPLLPISRRLARSLGRELALPVYLGMRHWQPGIEEVLRTMVADGVGEALAICLAPHYSDLSVGAYREELWRAAAATGCAIRLEMVDHWHLQADYLAGLADLLRETLDRFPTADRERVFVVFSAHSLPASILERGDPYADQLYETAAHLAAQLALPRERWTLAYQSASRGPQPWLGPTPEEVLAARAAAGERNLLIAPIGFLADNLELLYDIDIQLQASASSLGVRLERMPSLNDSPALVRALAGLARQHLAASTRSL